jgi:hypothetical protein
LPAYTPRHGIAADLDHREIPTAQGGLQKQLWQHCTGLLSMPQATLDGTLEATNLEGMVRGSPAAWLVSLATMWWVNGYRDGGTDGAPDAVATLVL